MKKRKNKPDNNWFIYLALLALIWYGGQHNWFQITVSAPTQPTTTTLDGNYNPFVTPTTTVYNNGQCVDSDNGLNYYTSGHCEDPVVMLGYADSCNDDLWLKEYYCSNNRCVSNNVMCNPTYFCEEGRCRPQTDPITTTTLAQEGDPYCNSLCISQGYSYGGYDGGWVQCDDFEHHIYNTPCCCHTAISLDLCVGTQTGYCGNIGSASACPNYYRTVGGFFYQCFWDANVNLCRDLYPNSCNVV